MISDIIHYMFWNDIYDEMKCLDRVRYMLAH